VHFQDQADFQLLFGSFVSRFQMEHKSVKPTHCPRGYIPTSLRVTSVLFGTANRSEIAPV